MTISQKVFRFSEVAQFLETLRNRMDRGTEKVLDTLPRQYKKVLTEATEAIYYYAEPGYQPFPDFDEEDFVYFLENGGEAAIVAYKERTEVIRKRDAERRAYAKRRDQEIRRYKR